MKRVILLVSILFIPAALFAFQPLFDTWIAYPVGINPTHALAADLDNDGDLDLVASNHKSFSGGSFTVLFNEGNGTFNVDTTYEAPTTPAQTLAVDLDKDGDLELIVVSRGVQFAVFLNRTIEAALPPEAGRFRFAYVCPVANTAVGAVALDLKEDTLADTDVVTVSFAPRDLIQTFLNTGGKFPNGPDDDFRARAGTRSIAAADFNADGFPDVVVADSASDSISVFLNIGNGLFGLPTHYRVSNRPLGPLVIGFISLAPNSVRTADFDGDSDADVAVVCGKRDSVIIFKGNGNGTLTLQNIFYGVGRLPQAAVAANLDGDADIDLAVANLGGGSISILKNNGNATFSVKTDFLVKSDPLSLYAADLDGDGDFDLAAPNDSGNAVTVLINDGNADFFNGTPYATGVTPVGITLADLDGDGDLDLAVANKNSNTLSIFLNNGNGSFSAGTTPFTGGAPNFVVACNLDGDGDVDLVTSNQTSGTISVLKNNGDGTFASEVPYQVGTASPNPVPDGVACADFDGDGDNDLAVTCANQNVLTILKNNGDGTFAVGARVNVTTGNSPTSVAAADLDGDGDIDLAVSNQGISSDLTTNKIIVYLNDGTGFFVPAVDLQTGSVPIQVVACDLNGEGDVDLAVANKGAPLVPANTVSIFENNGDGTFAGQVVYPVGGFPNSIFAGDFDGDGRQDLLTANSASTSNSFSFLKNNGDSTFAPAIEYGAGGRNVHYLFGFVVGGDLDGDGDREVVVTNSADNKISVFKNLSIPLANVLGDVNGDGLFSLSDIVAEFNCVFLGEGLPGGFERADINCNGFLNSADVVVLLNGYYLISPLPACP